MDGWANRATISLRLHHFFHFSLNWELLSVRMFFGFFGNFSRRDLLCDWFVIELLAQQKIFWVVINAYQKPVSPSINPERSFDVQLPKLIRLLSSKELPSFLSCSHSACASLEHRLLLFLREKIPGRSSQASSGRFFSAWAILAVPQGLF